MSTGSEVSTDVNAAVAKLALPAGVVISQGGQIENQTELFVSIASTTFVFLSSGRSLIVTFVPGLVATWL